MLYSDGQKVTYKTFILRKCFLRILSKKLQLQCTWSKTSIGFYNNNNRMLYFGHQGPILLTMAAFYIISWLKMKKRGHLLILARWDRTFLFMHFFLTLHILATMGKKLIFGQWPVRCFYICLSDCLFVHSSWFFF